MKNANKLVIREGQKTMQVICKANYNYEESLTKGKVYEVVAEEGIFQTRPYFRFIGDDGKEKRAHQTSLS